MTEDSRGAGGVVEDVTRHCQPEEKLHNEQAFTKGRRGYERAVTLEVEAQEKAEQAMSRVLPRRQTMPMRGYREMALRLRC